MDPFLIGIDLGGTEVKLGLFTAAGEMLDQRSVPTRDGETVGGVPAFLFETRNGLAALLEQHCAAGQAFRIGVAAPGFVAADSRSIAHMPGRLKGLQGLDWATALGTADAVPLLNDAHAALLGELWQGAVAGAKNAFMLTLGTGVGGAAVVDGELLKGHLGRAGHLGHITLDANGEPDNCGTPGSLEDAIGNHNVTARSGFETTHALVAAVDSGDPQALAHWTRSVHGLAAGIASLINVLDPESVIIGGGISKAGETLLAPLRAELDSMEWRPAGHAVRIVPAELGPWAGTYGAAWNVKA